VEAVVSLTIRPYLAAVLLLGNTKFSLNNARRNMIPVIGYAAPSAKEPLATSGFKK